MVHFSLKLSDSMASPIILPTTWPTDSSQLLGASHQPNLLMHLTHDYQGILGKHFYPTS